jgi:hypothetical protein
MGSYCIDFYRLFLEMDFCCICLDLFFYYKVICFFFFFLEMEIYYNYLDVFCEVIVSVTLSAACLDLYNLGDD